MLEGKMMKSPPSCPAISFKIPGYKIAAAPLILIVFVSTYIRPAGSSLPAPEASFPGLMLMYGKEASNRKQGIDRQHHTIPNQRPKDKHCGKI